MNSLHQPDAGLQWVAKDVGEKQTLPTAWPQWPGCHLGPATMAREGSTSNSVDYCMGGGGTSDDPIETSMVGNTTPIETNPVQGDLRRAVEPRPGCNRTKMPAKPETTPDAKVREAHEPQRPSCQHASHRQQRWTDSQRTRSKRLPEDGKVKRGKPVISAKGPTPWSHH